MAGFEDLIRSTLKKQGDHSIERREAIYESSRQALERMLRQNDKLDAEAAGVQRTRLEAAIKAIEDDYLASEALHSSEPPAPTIDPSPPVSEKFPSGEDLHAKEPPAPKVDPSPPLSAETSSVSPPPVSAPPVMSATRATPVGSSLDLDEPDAKPSVPPPQPKLKAEPAPEIVASSPGALSATRSDVPADPQPAPSAVEPDDVKLQDYEGKALREKRPFAKLLLWAIILAGLGTAIWWAITFGPELLKAQLDGSVDNPKPRIETGGFVPENEGGWVSIFDPASDPESIETGENGRAELVSLAARQVARLASAAETNSTVKIRIPRGIMETLRGKAATFEVTLAALPGQAQQFALYCEFSEMGNCGRKRFRATPQPESHIFDVLINDASLGEGEDAFISINTDLSATGKAIDLHSIKVRTGT